VKVLVSGASGLIGTALASSLESQGDSVVRLARSGSGAPDRLVWDPSAGEIDVERLEEVGVDAVVHLAGESVGVGRWTRSKKARIRDSRVGGTQALSKAIARLRERPRVLISASAVGWYGDRGTEPLSEASGRGSGFLADVTEAWEGATEPAAAAGVRVVKLRFGIVLSTRGGALERMLPPFRLGVGGPFGNGRQFMSWITLDDVVGVVRHALDTESLEGPVNAVAPNPVTNREFVRTLGRVLRRPAIMPLPAPALRLALGEFADESLLASARAFPARLMESGYRFRDPTLEPALRGLLERS
jgi:uncharacterized protein (TIGR01777 family)